MFAKQIHAIAIGTLLCGCYGGVDGQEPPGESTDGATNGGSEGSGGDEQSGDGDGGDDGDDGRESVDPSEPLDCSGDVYDPGNTIVARLTRFEYINTVRDAFGIDISAQAESMPFEIRDPLSTTALPQSTDFQHVTLHAELAELVVEQMGDFAADYSSCLDFSDPCERELVERLGAAAFRRPLREEEVEHYLPLFDVVQEEGDDFEVAAGLVLRSLMMSAPFLYHLVDERGSGPKRVSDHELANRISYLVWHSAPDAELTAAADEGALATAEQIEAQVRRMIADPRFEAAALTFVEDWVDLTRLERAVSYIDDDMKARMRQETETFISYVLTEQGGGLLDLLTEDSTFLDAELAELYGLPAPDEEFGPYDLEAVENRRGLLTQASILAAHSNGSRPSTVSRGLFILRSVLCRDIPDPPPGVSTEETELPEDASEREKSQERLDRGTCGACHQGFDPLAYAFEGYNGLGEWDELDSYGNVTQSDGWVPPEIGFPPDHPRGQRFDYEGIDGLVETLSSLDFVNACAAELPLTFTMRRPLDETVKDDACAIQSVADTVASSDGSYESLLVAIATHPMFANVRAR